MNSILSIPLIIEEISSSSEYKNDVYKTEGGTLFCNVQIVGKVMSRNKSEEKEDGNKKPPSILIGDLQSGSTVKCIPNFFDNDIWDQFLLLNDNDIVHIVGEISFYQPEEINGFIPPVSKHIKVTSISKVNNEDYVNIWYYKLLKFRKGDKIPKKSKIYENFVIKQNIKHDGDGLFFSVKESDISSYENIKYKITFESDEEEETNDITEKKSKSKKNNTNKVKKEENNNKKSDLIEINPLIDKLYEDDESEDEDIQNETLNADSNKKEIKKFLKRKT